VRLFWNMARARKQELAIGSGYAPLYQGIVTLLEGARQAAGRAVNSILTAAYWEIGRRIVEEEQNGQRKAGYGEQLIGQLASGLTGRFGRGFSRTNVFQMRQFFLVYREIVQTPSGQLGHADKLPTPSGQSASLPNFPLSWSHYVRLLSVQREDARSFL
jgi:hypothetical protein